MQIERFNHFSIQKLKADSKVYDVQVKNCKGLVLRINPKGTISFIYRFQLLGKRRKMSIGTFSRDNLRQAKVEYDFAVTQVENGVDPITERELNRQADDDNPLFAEFAERFIKNHVKKKLAAATAKEYERQIRKHFIPAWGKRKVADIQRKQIVKLIETLSDTAPVQANRTLATIKKMFSYAFDVGVAEANPASRIKPPGKEAPKTRVLDLEEITTLFDVLDVQNNRDTRDILKLITLTAQRPGEVAEMRASQLKEDAEGLWFELEPEDVKNNEPTRIYINDMAAQIIKNRIDDLALTHYIFPARTKGDKPESKPSSFLRKDTLVSKVRRIQPILKELGVKQFTAHDLRRSAATGIARLGHGAIVDDILNHKARGITRKVYDLYDRSPEIKRALTAWGEAIQRAIDGNQANVISINQ